MACSNAGSGARSTTSSTNSCSSIWSGARHPLPRRARHLLLQPAQPGERGGAKAIRRASGRCRPIQRALRSAWRACRCSPDGSAQALRQLLLQRCLRRFRRTWRATRRAGQTAPGANSHWNEARAQRPARETMCAACGHRRESQRKHRFRKQLPAQSLEFLRCKSLKSRWSPDKRLTPGWSAAGLRLGPHRHGHHDDGGVRASAWRRVRRTRPARRWAARRW